MLKTSKRNQLTGDIDYTDTAIIAGLTGGIRMPNNFDTVSIEQIEQRTLKIIAENNTNFTNNTNKKIYFAGPWFDDRANALYDSCKAIINSVNNVMVEIFYPRETDCKRPKYAFDTDVKQIKECDALLALVSRKDVGTAWEIGMAYALGKPIYLLGYDETTFLSHTNVMLAFTGKCFTIDYLGEFIKNGELPDKHLVHIKNEWEGIE